MVHKTAYQPRDNKILPIISDTRPHRVVTGTLGWTYNGMVVETPTYQFRKTVHFSVNHEVAGHLMGDWKDREYTIIMPMQAFLDQKDEKSRVRSAKPVDFFIKGDVSLPQGTIIICPAKSIKEIEKNNPGITAIGYEKDVDPDGLANSVMANLGYIVVEGDPHSIRPEEYSKDYERIMEKQGLNTFYAHNGTLDSNLEETFWVIDYLVSQLMAFGALIDKTPPDEKSNLANRIVKDLVSIDGMRKEETVKTTDKAPEIIGQLDVHTFFIPLLRDEDKKVMSYCSFDSKDSLEKAQEEVRNSYPPYIVVEGDNFHFDTAKYFRDTLMELGCKLSEEDLQYLIQLSNEQAKAKQDFKDGTFDYEKLAKTLVRIGVQLYEKEKAYQKQQRKDPNEDVSR